MCPPMIDRASRRLPVACRVCGRPCSRRLVVGTDRLRAGSTAPYPVGWCPRCRCGTTQLEAGASYWALAYPKEYFERSLGVGQTVDRTMQMRAIGSVMPLEGARILEIGCSAGDLLLLARDAGARVCGVEPSELSRAIARGRGLEVHASVEAVDPAARFDLCALFDVLEHLPEPRRVLADLAGRLAPDGRIVINVPNIESHEARIAGAWWWGLELPRHLSHFSSRAVERLARLCGLRCVGLTYGTSGFLAQSFVDARLANSWLTPGSLSFRALRHGLGRVQRLLGILGNKPSITAVLAR